MLSSTSSKFFAIVEHNGSSKQTDFIYQWSLDQIINDETGDLKPITD
jgi:hypothetical protein